MRIDKIGSNKRGNNMDYLRTKFHIESGVKEDGSIVEIVEYAVFEDGTKSIIKVSDSGYRYFTINNPYAKRDTSRKDKMADNEFKLELKFQDRICDAIQAVTEGYADAFIETDILFFHSIKSIVILDREKAAEIRNQIIEKYKNVEFGYRIVAQIYAIKECLTADGVFTSDMNESMFITDGAKAKEMAEGYIAEALHLSTVNTSKELIDRLDTVYCMSKEGVVLRLAYEIIVAGFEEAIKNFRIYVMQDYRKICRIEKKII